MTTLHGLIPILATPFDPDLDLDVDGLRALVRFQLACGVDGLGLLGMASEAFTLDERERDRVVTVVREETRGDVPLIVGAGGTALAPALEQARRMADLGADALMVLPPGMVAHGPDQLVAFFEGIAHVGLPVMVQDAPALTGTTIAPALLARICATAGVDYVKTEAQPTARRVADAAAAVVGAARVIGGQNAQFLLEELDRGAVGTMPACEMSDVLRAILDADAAGDRTGARAQFDRLLPLLRYGLQPGLAWAVHKHVLVDRGVIASPAVRAPAQPLDRASLDGLRPILDDLALPPAAAVLAGDAVR